MMGDHHHRQHEQTKPSIQNTIDNDNNFAKIVIFFFIHKQLILVAIIIVRNTIVYGVKFVWDLVCPSIGMKGRIGGEWMCKRNRVLIKINYQQ